ncbi:IS3 family transposase [Symmachiella dynata]|uniref:IS3 family transposase n=1 Tax=Symmachiella dynata TaxID=2527995 RepID=UPI0030EF8954
MSQKRQTASKRTRRSFSEEFKIEAVKLVTEQKYKVAEAARNLGVADGQLRRWMDKYSEIEDATENEELKRLRAEVKRLRMERDIPKKSGGLLCQRKELRFQFILEHLACWPVVLMCRVLHVSTSGFYAWKRRPQSWQVQRRETLQAEIQKIHQTKNKDSYGSPRVHQELRKQGTFCCENTVAKVMQESGIQAKTVKKFQVTTDSKHTYSVVENVLDRQFDRATKPNQIWVSDITYVWTQEGWMYLTCVLDLYSRKVVGWSMSSRMTKEFVMEALEKAIRHRCPKNELLHHSDRGSQYASEAYRELLTRNGITCSMSRKGNCWDNAVMESFFATLKKELIHHERYETRSAAWLSIFEYIEVFYNPQRLHSTLGYQSPEHFEQAV